MNAKSKRSRTGAGAATFAGVEYQNAIAVWLATHILAGAGASLPFGLPSNVQLLRVSVETGDAVDDIRADAEISVPVKEFKADASRGYNVYIQAKRSLAVSKNNDSELAKVVAQFVAQRQPVEPAEDERNQSKSRLILAVSSGASTTIRTHAASALNRLREGADQQSLSVDENTALTYFTAHIERIWSEEFGTPISEEVLSGLLSIIYILTIDVLDDGTDERYAKTLLRTVILHDYSQDVLAWNTLLAKGLTKGRQRGSFDYSSLEGELSSAGLKLKSSVDYENDIEKLRQRSDRDLESLNRRSITRIGGKEIRIHRAIATELCRVAASQCSFVVVGLPGAGKTATLCDAAAMLSAEGYAVLVVRVDCIDAKSAGGLREEMQLDHEFVDVLRNWRPAKGGVVLIDALDAARNAQNRSTFLDLMDEIISHDEIRWSIVTSIRKFDLTNDSKIQRIFPTERPSAFSDESVAIAHVHVPVLADNELQKFGDKSSKLSTLIESSNADILALLRIPFYLNIAAELIGRGTSVDVLANSRGYELLERYWSAHFDDNYDSDARLQVMDRALRHMVESRTMTVSRSEIMASFAVPPTEQLHALLSEGILVEDDNHRLRVEHHILYDFGVYKLVLRDDDGALERALREDNALVFSIRPSIQMYLERAWSRTASHREFWSEAIRLENSDGVSNLARAMVAEFAVSRVGDAIDVAPLLDSINAPDQQQSEAAREVMRRCSNVMDFNSRHKIVVDAIPWIGIVDASSRYSRGHVIRVAEVSILLLITNSWTELSMSQQKACGCTVRRLFESEINLEQPNEWLSRSLIDLTVRTYRTDSVASRSLLERLLEQNRVRRFGYIELRHVAYAVGSLAAIDPDLVGNVYDVAFSYREVDTSQTSLSASQILGLSSNRKQDYGMVLYTLGDNYRQVIDVNLTLGLRILQTVSAHGEYVSVQSSGDPDFVLKYNGEEVGVYDDSSGVIWHSDDDRFGEDRGQTFRGFSSFVDELVSTADGPDKFVEALTSVVPIAHSTSFWLRILQAGERNPTTLGIVLAPLLLCKGLLITSGVVHQCGDFLSVVFSHLSADSRSAIEGTVLSIAPLEQTTSSERLERIRDRYIRVLDEEAILSEAIRDRQVSLRADNNLDAGQVGDVDFRARENEDEVSPYDVLMAQVTDQLNKFDGQSATSSDIDDLFSTIASLESVGEEGTPRIIRSRAEELSARACLNAVNSGTMTPEDARWADLRGEVVRYCNAQDPEPSARADRQFEDGTVQYTGSTRQFAATALMLTVAKEGGVDSVSEQLIRKLASDSTALVRSAVARHLYLVGRAGATGLMWELTDRLGQDDSAHVAACMCNSIGQFSSIDTARTVKAIERIVLRFRDEVPENIIEIAAAHLAWAYVFHGSADAYDSTLRIVDTAQDNPHGVWKVVTELRGSLVAGIEEGAAAKAAVRARTIGLFMAILASTETRLASLNELYDVSGMDRVSDPDLERLKNLHRAVRETASQVYFASGTYEENSGKKGLSRNAKVTFLKEVRLLLEKISDTGDAHAANEVVALAQRYQDIDPLWVLQLVERAVVASEPSGGTRESLFVDTVVDFVRSFIRSNLAHLSTTESQNRLVRILDGFSKVGWPEVIGLTQDLNEVFGE
ncbi:ATP-binding protein [Nocardia sp. XZ_19_231]|uniref:ATP-binding protein n=1 Tax=Nocardia sp. XZ_19_231 TaxID=2769252 RepID=UPI00188E508A|nr:ATP-binding protein [Nocardia sp. XZ_19_231]